MDKALFTGAVSLALPLLSYRKFRREHPIPPIANRKPHLVQFGGKVHGEKAMEPPVNRVDNLFWLRDDERKDAAVIAHLEEENTYTELMTSHLAPLREELYDEFKSRLQETDVDVPLIEYHEGRPWWYFTRTEEGKSYSIHCRAPLQRTDASFPTAEEVKEVLAALRSGSVPGEHVVLDENELARGNSMCDVHSVEVSENGEITAYTVDFSGEEKYDIRFCDARTSTSLLPFTGSTDVIHNTDGTIEWSADGKSVFYLTLDDMHRPYKVWRHILGTSQESDVCLYTEEDEKFWVGIEKSLTKDFLLISTSSKITSEVRVVPLTNRAAASLPPGIHVGGVHLIQPRIHNVLYSVSHHVRDGVDCFIITNNQNAKNFRVCIVRADKTDVPNWREIIAHDPTVMVSSLVPFRDFWAVDGRTDGYENVWVIPSDSMLQLLDERQPAQFLNAFPRIPSKDPVYVSSVTGGNTTYAAPGFRFLYSSPVTPHQICFVSAASAPIVDWDSTVRVLKQKPVPNVDLTKYTSCRISAAASDGKSIPISLVYRQDRLASGLGAGHHPGALFLDGYGSYGIPNDLYFNASVLSLCDRGIIYGVAHIRGGGEMGRSWYEDEGRQLTKWNTFKDFIACAEHLIETGWTNKGQIVAHGASAGGLLMGVVMNERPDLWAGVCSQVCYIAGVGRPSLPATDSGMQVGFVDVLNTMSDESIPLTVTEYDEWGNPHEKDYFEYMLSYSPIDNVKPQHYPQVLLTAGLHDSRVAYWEPAKFAQRLRDVNNGSSKILLKTELVGGHFSFIDRYAYLRDKAFNYAWVLDILGCTNPTK